MANCADIAATLMEHLCNHEWHGYSQYGRWGDGEGTCAVNAGGTTYYLEQGDRDCSSAVIDCWRHALLGTAYEGALDDATYTGNMRSVFTSSGLFEVWDTSSTSAQRGDVYLNDECHTAMCISADPDMLGEFSISENNTIDGEGGDQTGWESSVHGYYDYPWSCTLHYNGRADSNSGYVPDPSNNADVTPTNDQCLPRVRYRAYTNASGWLDEMENRYDTGGSNDDYAGDGSPIAYLAMDFTGWYQVRTVDGGWLDRVSKYDINDLEYGCAGDGSPITAVRCYYETANPDSTGWLAIRYAVADVNGSWLDEMEDTTDTGGSGDDFAGDGCMVGMFYAYITRC